MSMVLSSWQNYCESSPAVHLMNVERRQATANPQTKPNNLGCESACMLPESTPTIAIYFLLLSPKADTHFTVPRRLES